jgi:hypothetical protein
MPEHDGSIQRPIFRVDWSPPTLRGVPKQRSDGCGHYSHLDDVSARALA